MNKVIEIKEVTGQDEVNKKIAEGWEIATIAYDNNQNNWAYILAKKEPVFPGSDFIKLQNSAKEMLKYLIGEALDNCTHWKDKGAK